MNDRPLSAVGMLCGRIPERQINPPEHGGAERPCQFCGCELSNTGLLQDFWKCGECGGLFIETDLGKFESAEEDEDEVELCQECKEPLLDLPFTDLDTGLEFCDYVCHSAYLAGKAEYLHDISGDR